MSVRALISIALVATLSACGEGRIDPDAGVDATTDSEWPDVPGFPDAASPDAKPPYAIIDGGACDAAPLEAGDLQVRTCCNGMICRGKCVVYDGTDASVCVCASLNGGCPESLVCCTVGNFGCDVPSVCHKQGT